MTPERESVYPQGVQGSEFLRGSLRWRRRTGNCLEDFQGQGV